MLGLGVWFITENDDSFDRLARTRKILYSPIKRFLDVAHPIEAVSDGVKIAEAHKRHDAQANHQDFYFIAC